MWILYCLCLVVSAASQNDVRLPPSITQSPDREIIFKEYQDIKLKCSAKGTPPPTFKWTQNLKISRGQRHQNFPFLGVFDGELTIKNATRNDDGYYQCFVTNQYGTAISTVAHIQHAFIEGGSSNYVNITVQEGHPFVIPAARRNSFPEPTYSWEIATAVVDAYPIKFLTTQRVNSAFNGDLYFAYALKEDELDGGIYKSTARNAHADQVVGGSYTRVNVTQGSGTPPDFPPNITYFANSQEVALIGRSIELKCFFSGKPLPDITWSRPGRNLPIGRHSIPSSQYGTLLNISNIMDYDEGDYVCTANNTMGTASHTLDIRVEAGPTFKRVYDFPRDVNVTEGDSITFNCSAYAKPEATVVWLRNGHLIDVTLAHNRFVFSNENRSLTISDVCRDCVDRVNKTDLMVIQCNASNVHGYAFAQGYLNVLTRTKVTLMTASTVVSVDLTKENRFQFDCSAISDPSTPPTVRWYKVVNQSQELVYTVLPYVYVKDGKLTIYTEPSCSSTCEKYLGEYKCIGDNGYTQDSATVILNGTIGSWSPSYCNGCFDKTSTDSQTSTNHAKDDVLTSTMAPEIASRLPAKSTKSEDPNSDDLSTATMINKQRIESTTKGVTESGLNNSSNENDIRGDDLKTTAPMYQTAVADITNQLSALTKLYKSEGLLSLDDLSTAIMIKSQGLYSTTRGVTESGLTDNTSNTKVTKVDDLKTTAPMYKTAVAEITNQSSALTNNSGGLGPGSLNTSVMIRNQLAALLKDRKVSASEEQIKSNVQVISNILHPNNSNAWKELNDMSNTAAQDILSIMDDFGLVLCNLSKPGHVTVATENLVLEAWSFEMLNQSFQIEFPNDSLWVENRGDKISISMETLNGDNLPALNMWGVYYRTIHDQLPGKNDTNFVNSRVLSFSIDGKSNETLKIQVLITLGHNEEKGRSYRRMCSFWNFNRSDWDSDGCSVSSTNKTHTICSCDHLTNFAILMSRNPVYDDTVLSLISIIGCSISVAALALTVIVYAVTWKHAKSSQAALLLNLCIVLIIAYIIFMTGADKIDSSGYSMDGCKAVAVLLHYFFLVAFFIMLAEGIDMVLYIFFVFHVRRTRETVMLIASAWVLPLIIVGVSLGVTRLEGYGREEACWLSSEKGLIWAFIGPVLCIIAINLVILIIILRLISQKKAILAKNSRKRQEIRATIWNLSVMCPVLGLGWLFGVFSVSFDHPVFQYVFVIANSLHGLLIFIIYALFHNKKLNEKISAVYSQYLKTDSSNSTQMNNSSQEHSANSTANTQMRKTSLQPKSSDSNEFGTKAAVSTHKSGLKDSLLENNADVHRETAFDHR